MTDENKQTEKKNKPKGPIRTGAVIPFIIVVGTIILFNLFLLDSTIKKAIEFAGEKVNGAEVNVGNVNTSFGDLKIKVTNIEFTNKDKPDLNKVQIGSMDFQLMWDALLRGKFVINMANVNNILINTKRSRPGFVTPVDENGDSESNKAAKEMLGKAKKEFEGNVFGDIAGVLAGGSTGDVAGNIEGTLESKKRFDELGIELKEKEKLLAKDLSNLPKKKELEALQTRLKKIRWKDLGNLLKAPGVLKEADNLNKDIKKALKSYDTAGKNFNKSIKDIDSSYKEAEALIQKDIESVSKRMNLPKLDQKSIAKMLFGNEVLSKVSEAKKYQTLAQKYIPPRNAKVKKVKPKRGKGTNYSFGTPNSYPLFWLKLAKIDSKNDQGRVEGKIENVTNDQKITGKLTTINVEADFPKEDIRDISGKISIDHRDEPKAVVSGRVGNYLVKNKALSKSSDATFIIDKSNASSTFQGTLKPESAVLVINNKFRNIKYITKAKSPAVDEVLRDVAKKNSLLTLDAKVKGKWDSLAFDIKSNLASAIESSVRSLVREKITAAQNKIKADIEKQISSSRAAVDKQVNGIKSKFNKELAEGKKQMDKVKNQLKSEEKKAKKKAQKSIKNPFKGIKL
jgi:uncharacterized protein (TIGR03545 family)